MAEFGRGKTGLGVLVAIANVLIWRHYVPNVADIRTAQPFNGDVETAERTALTHSVIFTLVAAMFAQSFEVFTIGGLVIVALDFSAKHANAIHPDTGKMADSGIPASGLSESFPMPDYANAEAS